MPARMHSRIIGASEYTALTGSPSIYRNGHLIGDPAGNRHQPVSSPYRHRRDRVAPAYSAGADKQCLAAGFLHDPGMRRRRRVQHRQNLVAAMDQFLQSRRF